MSESPSFLKPPIIDFGERGETTLHAHCNRLLYLLTCHSKHYINTAYVTRVSNIVPVRSSRVHCRAVLRNMDILAFIITSDEKKQFKE